jgi:hypothetical protein
VISAMRIAHHQFVEGNCGQTAVMSRGSCPRAVGSGLWQAATQREYALAAVLRPLYRVAVWAAGCTPSTPVEGIGGISYDLARAEQLLREHESWQ